jgi:hypothetical protein
VSFRLCRLRSTSRRPPRSRPRTLRSIRSTSRYVCLRGRHVGRTPWRIRVCGVSTRTPGVLQYGPDKPLIFEKLDFGVGLDTRACVVGPNGSGKSTVIKLLFGHLDPTKVCALLFSCTDIYYPGGRGGSRPSFFFVGDTECTSGRHRLVHCWGGVSGYLPTPACGWRICGFVMQCREECSPCSTDVIRIHMTWMSMQGQGQGRCCQRRLRLHSSLHWPSGYARS